MSASPQLYERYQQYIEQSRRIIQAIDKAYPEKEAVKH
jgi:preprotein translocase subunit Sss1